MNHVVVEVLLDVNALLIRLKLMLVHARIVLILRKALLENVHLLVVLVKLSFELGF